MKYRKGGISPDVEYLLESFSLPVKFEKLVKPLGYYTTMNVLPFQENLKLFVKFK
jgi:hypothetical protein